VSIKNIHVKHWVKRTKTGVRYLCIHSCNPTKEKIAKTKNKVTCKNCKRELKSGS